LFRDPLLQHEKDEHPIRSQTSQQKIAISRRLKWNMSLIMLYVLLSGLSKCLLTGETYNHRTQTASSQLNLPYEAEGAYENSSHRHLFAKDSR